MWWHGQTGPSSGQTALRTRAAVDGGRLTAGAWAWRVAVEAQHPGGLVALAAPRRPGRSRWGAGSSAGDSRAASTAYEFRTPVMLPPVKPASVCGIQPEVSAVATAGASLA